MKKVRFISTHFFVWGDLQIPSRGLSQWPVFIFSLENPPVALSFVYISHSQAK